jgi:hypothetical protein
LFTSPKIGGEMQGLERKTAKQDVFKQRTEIKMASGSKDSNLQ